VKRKTTKEILTESFRELAESKSIDRITVQEIVDNCDYSTATFYRHFRDKYDLIAWDYARKAEEIMAQLITDDTRWNQTLMDWAEFFQTEKEYLANLFLHTSGHDSFIQYMTEIHYRAFTKHLRAVSRRDELDEKTSLLARTYCLGTVYLSCEWITGKYDVTPDELAEIYGNALPQPLLELMKEK
jgi:AcrR family transcriptional regulator